jgi:outer membrane receptor protein involved in Fe transport
MKLRFGAAITVARPRLDELGGGASYNVTSDQSNPTIIDGTPYYWSRNGGGNPKLEPWKANTFDLSFEKYFGDNKGYSPRRRITRTSTPISSTSRRLKTSRDCHCRRQLT